ncbi:MAG TPA: hypothetical protein VHJ82_06120 [Actinomycetota bacterium]|nr:hypothetical protein [Actinomycetota bacterium]
MGIYTGVLERAAEGATGASAALFASLSRARGKRFFHPHGKIYSGSATFRTSGLDLPFEGTTRVLVRLSRGAGVPLSLPDVFGLAIKLQPVEHDFLLATSGEGVVTRHLLLPGAGFFSLPYSSVLPYELHDDLVVFGARASDELKKTNSGDPNDLDPHVGVGRLRFELSVSVVGSPSWETFGEVTLSGFHEEDVKFNPWNCAPPLRPAGPLNRLRLDTYQASQAAR